MPVPVIARDEGSGESSSLLTKSQSENTTNVDEVKMTFNMSNGGV